MSENLFYQHAIDYIKAGFAVFPLKPRGKEPLTKRGFHDASTDPAQVKSWWQQYPNANIGIATGQASHGLCVIDMDIDEKKGLDGFTTFQNWSKDHGYVPPSWTSRTGRGGFHFFFHSDEPVSNRVNLLPGVDVRGDGGYIVAPPSIHPNGNAYEWMPKLSPDDLELCTIDDNLRYLLSGKNADRQSFQYLSPVQIPEGERNHTLFRFACMMQAKGAADETIYAATMAENNVKCNPPLPERDVQRIVKSVQKYEKGKPIYFPSSGDPIQGYREPNFALDSKGFIKKTWDNMREAIEFDPELYEHIKYNILACSIWVYGELPWEHTDTYRQWRDSDDKNLKLYLEKRYGFNNDTKILDALAIVADKYRFNPVTDELTKIAASYTPSQYKGQIRKLLVDYMGVENTTYNYEVFKCYMLGAISRAFHPGCKFDYTIILFGAQGFGKSEFIRKLALCPEWFNDNFNTFEGDKASEKLAGMWMVELAELKALKSSKDSESIKSFLTSRYDTYREPYARRTVQRPRMCVFAGTTNNMSVFVDKTGNRRFFPIITRKGKQTKDLFGDPAKVSEDFRLAWAEAMAIYNASNGQPLLTLTDEISEEAAKMQEQFLEEDYRIGVIQNWLDNTDATMVCVPQVIEYALNSDIERMPKQHRREVQEILENEIAGWHRVQNKNKGRSRFNKYGQQIAFIRDE